MVVLQRQVLEDTTLAAAMDRLSRRPMVGVLMAPDACVFTRLAGARPDLPPGCPPWDELAPRVFEARLFDVAASPDKALELRWLHHGGGRGRAVQVAVRNDGTAADDDMPADDVLPQTYLLFGRQLDLPTRDGWSCLWEARIAAQHVPFPGLPAGHGIELQCAEYLAVDERHGNTYVAEELIHGWRAVPVD